LGQMAPKLSVDAMRWSNGAEGLLPRLTLKAQKNDDRDAGSNCRGGHTIHDAQDAADWHPAGILEGEEFGWARWGGHCSDSARLDRRIGKFDEIAARARPTTLRHPGIVLTQVVAAISHIRPWVRPY
jgi:hypothetical protein